MSPFSTPERVVVLTRPQDMRAGVNRLSAVVRAELGEDPSSGDLYVFVSRDCRRIRMPRNVGNAWCMWCVTAIKGGFRWRPGGGPGPALEADRTQLAFLLEGLEMAPPPAADTVRWPNNRR